MVRPRLVPLPDLLIYFLSLRLQAVLKDPKHQQSTALVDIRRRRKVFTRTRLGFGFTTNRGVRLGGHPTSTDPFSEIGSTTTYRKITQTIDRNIRRLNGRSQR